MLGAIQSEQTSQRLTIYLAALVHMLTPNHVKTIRNRSKPTISSPPKPDLLPHYSKGVARRNQQMMLRRGKQRSPSVRFGFSLMGAVEGKGSRE